MNKDIGDFVSRCLVCQQVKAKHQRPASFHQQIEISKWKWEKITMDFITRLPWTSQGVNSIWVIID